MSAGGDEEGEPHENHERYLITYADMITLLMALFIILYAIGQTDLKKYEQFAEGAAEAFGGGGDGPFEEGNSLTASALEELVPRVDSTDGELIALLAPPAPDLGVVNQDDSEEGEGGAAAASADGHIGADEAEAVAAELGPELAAGGTGIEVAVVPLGVRVTFPADQMAFESGSWELSERGRALLDRIAPLLLDVDNDVVVEGHTDDLPMGGGLTNWELSTNRAVSVVRYLQTGGIPMDRLAATGYAETRPRETNDTEAGRAANRRVELTVLTTDPSAPEAV